MGDRGTITSSSRLACHSFVCMTFAMIYAVFERHYRLLSLKLLRVVMVWLVHATT